VEQLQVEQANLRAAMQWSFDAGAPARVVRIAAAVFQYVTGLSPFEGRLWLERALATGAGTAVERSKAAFGLGLFAFVRGDNTEAGARFEQAATLAREGEDGETLLVALARRAWIFAEQGQLDEAQAYADECRRISATVADATSRAQALNSIAVVEEAAGRPAQAEACYREALALDRQIGDELGAAEKLSNLGFSALLRGDYVDARRRLEEATAIIRRFGRKPFAIDGNLGLFALFEERYAEAFECFSEELRLSHEQGDQRYFASEAVLGLAAVEAALGRHDRAIMLRAAFEQFAIQHELVARLEPYFARAREALDPAAVAELTERGRTMTVEQILDELQSAPVAV
jgi:Flp pilus assembly protein TadD